MIARVVLSLLVAGVVGAGVTAFVASRVRRATSRSSREPTRPGVMFVVSARAWQGTVLAVGGVLFIVTGCVLIALAVFVGGSALGGGFPGAGIIIGGLVFLWLARRVMGVRLEVTPESVWVFRWTGAPRELPLAQISRLTALASNNYGGVVARAGRRRVFSASRLMLGYPQLIDYFRTQRPDLPIPDASWPF